MSTAPNSTPNPTPLPNSSDTSSNTTQGHGDGRTLDQMLRVRVIDGHFEGLRADAATFAVISVGNQSARTKIVKNTNHPVYEENFIVGYETRDAKSEVVIDVFDKGAQTDERLGEFRLRLAQIDPPKLRRKNRNTAATNDTTAANTGTTNTNAASTTTPNQIGPDTLPSDHTVLPEPKGVSSTSQNKNKAPKSWANAQPQKAIIINRKGTEVGYLTILVRREARLQGNLNVHVKEVDLSASGDQSFWAKPTSLVVKQGETRHEQPLDMTNINNAGAGQRIPVNGNWPFLINDSNNISDVFFELWQNGVAVAEARLPLYDVRKGYNGSLAFVGPFGGHDVTNVTVKSQIASLFVNADFQGQGLNQV